MLLWFTVLLIVRCYGSNEIPLARAEQSSIASGGQDRTAANAIDNDIGTASHTEREGSPWLRVYFKSSSTVERVVVEKGHGYQVACVFTVLVYDGNAGTVCGAYTGKAQ